MFAFFEDTFNRKPRKFNYIPRYYDPAQEARNRRRAELGLEPVDAKDLKPGDRLRARQILREENSAVEAKARRKSTFIKFLIFALLAAGLCGLLVSINF